MVACERDQPPPTASETAQRDLSPLIHRPEDVESLAVPNELRTITEPWKGDLQEMLERRVVRAAVARSGFFYYIRDGRERGVTSDFLRVFEKRLNQRFGLRGTNRVNVVAIPMTRDRLIRAVTDGRADIATAGLTITPDRERKVDFSEPWVSDVREVVITSPLARQIDNLEDLAGRQVVVRGSSSYYQSLRDLSRRFEKTGLQAIDIVPAHEIFEDEDLLEMLSVGMIGITVSDDYVADFWQQAFGGFKVHKELAVRTDGRIAWAFRKRSPELAEVINAFVVANRPGTRTGNVIVNRYIGDPARVTNALAGDRLRRLTLEEPLFRRVGEEFGFDWLKLAAQAYQESRLDNSKTSKAGAVGIMQVLPSTAKSMGINNYREISGNIGAGAKYMRHLVDDYFADEELSEINQWIFALAAYNAGATRISRLRRNAAEKGLDPNLWFDNVEFVVADAVGSEPVTYVRNVMKYYLAYRLTFEKEELRQEVLSKLANAG